MHIRPTTRADLPSIIDIRHASFLHNELFSWLYPGRELYPTTYRRMLSHGIRLAFASRASFSLICIADEADASWTCPGKILGYAFARLAEPGRRFDAATMPATARGAATTATRNIARQQAHNGTIGPAVERALLSLEKAAWPASWPWPLTRPDGVVSPENALVLARSPETGAWSALPAHWAIDAICVAPDAQRRGIGRRLTLAVLEWAREDGIPAALISSYQGELLYRQLGFLAVAKREPPTVDRLWRGGVELVWDPWGLWVRKREEGEGDGDSRFNGLVIHAASTANEE